MSEYIKLDDALEAYNQAVTTLVESEMVEFDLGDFTECSFNTTQIKLIARTIESLPTIEVSEDAISRPKGEWIAKDGVFYCSCCGNDSAGLSEDDVYVYEVPLPNYCQDCGADMRGADNE